MKIIIDIRGHGYDGITESVWAKSLGGDHYQILNSPFYAYGISYLDEIVAELKNDQLFLKSVIKHSGHSTYRLFIKDQTGFKDMIGKINKLDCTIESATEKLKAIDVAPHADINKLVALLSDGESGGVWEYEEGHFYGGEE